MDLQQEIMRLCDHPVHPGILYEKLKHLASADTIHSHLCRLVEDGLVDADANIIGGMDGDIVPQVHFVYGRMDKRAIGFIQNQGRKLCANI